MRLICLEMALAYGGRAERFAELQPVGIGIQKSS